MTIQDPPRHAELDRLPPEPDPHHDCHCYCPTDVCSDCAPDAFCPACGYRWDDCACDRHVPRVDETEGNSLSEERLEWEERG